MTVSEIIEILYGDIEIRNENGETLYLGKAYGVPADLLDKETFFMMPYSSCLVVDIKQ